MPAALIVFSLTYVLMIVLPKYRAFVALLAAAVFVVSGMLPPESILPSIDWNVLLMIAGTMGIMALFIESKMPSMLADLIIDRMPDVRWTVVALSLFSAIVSAFVDNVATVLMIAPVAITIAKKLRISPVPSIIAISIASNLEGAATLVGDTTSILLSGAAGMDFIDFFWMQGRPGMFWVVQLGLVAATLVVLYFFRRSTEPVEIDETTRIEDYFPTFLLGGTIGALILASFFPEKPDITNGLICVGFLVIGILYETIRQKSLSVLIRTVREVDYFTLLLLGSLFVVIGGIRQAGVIDAIAALFVQLGGGSPFVTYSILLWASVLFSAFIDNIPYVATMLPVVASIAAHMGTEPHVLYFGLLAGATLGGNLTPIGASANIASIGILRKHGYPVGNGAFMKLSVPYTLAAVTTGYIAIWLLWGIGA